MENSRRDFVKTVVAGTAGVSLAGITINASPYKKGLLPDESGYICAFSGGEEIFPPIFPIPREASYLNDFFKLTQETTIILPQIPEDQDKFLARMLISELAEQYGIVLTTKNSSDLSASKNYILIGSINNPLVKEYASKHGLSVSSQNPGHEGYFLQVTNSSVVILGSDDQGAFYGLQSLRQLINNQKAKQVQCVNVKDWPHKAFRGIKLYVPGPENIAFYKRFIRDFAAYFKYNRIIMELNACMRLDKHPELNAGAVEFAKFMDYTRRSRTTGRHSEDQDSAHHDAADGKILDKDQVADLVNYAKQFNIETIPEIPSLTHSYYLLTRHRELAEIANAEWPDTYCPSDPKSVKLYFDILDEYIDVMKPKIIHIGRDEWRMPTDICEKCKGKDYSELFVKDLLKIYNHLHEKNIRVALWGDHLMESVRGKGQESSTTSTGYKYNKPGGIPPEMIKNQIPKDILIFNWFWANEGLVVGEDNDKQLQEWGFQQVYGNLEPIIENYPRRSELKGMLGGAPSSWAATTEFNFGKDMLYDLMGCANLLWSTHWPDENELVHNIQNLVPTVRMNLKGIKPPSKDGDPIVSLDVSASFNTKLGEEPMGIPLQILKDGIINANGITFKLIDPKKNSNLCSTTVGNIGQSAPSFPTLSERIPIDKDVSSLIFLHTCARPAVNEKGYYKIYDFEDTADLLGWYKIVYQDGYVESLPIRYGVNIREWNLWANKTKDAYCYEGDIVNCSKIKDEELNFFSYEWRSTRFGTKIKEIYLEGSQQYENASGKKIDNNAIILVALSCVTKRDI